MFKLCFSQNQQKYNIFLISLNEIQGLEVHRVSDKSSLVETIFENVTNRLKSNETEYFFSVYCARCKIKMAVKRRKSYSQFEPAKKKICLDRRRQCYNNEKQNVLIARTEKYKSMNGNEKQNLLTARAEKYKSMDANEKRNLLTACAEKYGSMDANERQNLLTACAEKYVYGCK